MYYIALHKGMWVIEGRINTEIKIESIIGGVESQYG